MRYIICSLYVLGTRYEVTENTPYNSYLIILSVCICVSNFHSFCLDFGKFICATICSMVIKRVDNVDIVVHLKLKNHSSGEGTISESIGGGNEKISGRK